MLRCVLSNQSHTESADQEMDGSKEEVAPLIQQLLQDKAALLKECFGIEVDAEGRLAALPQLIEGHCPDLNRLPRFVLQLARDVDWENEQECFRGLAQVNCLLPACHSNKVWDTEKECIRELAWVSCSLPACHLNLAQKTEKERLKAVL